MGHLVEFPANGGGAVLVEVNAGSSGPVTRGMGAAAVVDKANESFELAVGRVQPAIDGVVARLRALPDAPDEVYVEFGLNLHAEAGAFIASASTTANFTVALTWRSKSPHGRAVEVPEPQ